MNRKISALLISLLLTVSILVIVNNDVDVKATEGGEGDGVDNGNNGLDLDYIWEQTLELSNVIYKYPEGLIPRGRYFGSWGANYTVFNITKPEMITMGLENVTELPIKHIPGRDWEYTSNIWVNDFQITVNNPNYPLPNPIPIKELFLIPAGRNNQTPTWLDGVPTFNNTLDNLELLPINLTGSLLRGLFSNYFYEIPDFTNLNNISLIILGNLTYITENETVPPPDEQIERVFLLNESEYCQDQLDNITNASGVIIIDKGTEGVNLNTDACKYSVIKIAENNGTDIINILKNYTDILVDNIAGNLTFTYNFSDTGKSPCSDYIIIDRIPDHNELADGVTFPTDLIKTMRWVNEMETSPPYYFTDYIGCWVLQAAWHWLKNKINLNHPFGGPLCKGIILYSSFETHWMIHTGYNFKNEQYKWELGKLPENINTTIEVLLSSESPRIQTFTMNYTVGSFLTNNHTCTTLTGYGNQSLLKETQEKPAVEAYNVIGNITIDKSPNNSIALISNRIDGWWGQTPGDSGIGGAIILGIAKYFKDYNIKPKYNLTFLFTTGEEIGFRGAWHYNHSHPNDNIIFYLGLDQLGMSQQDQTLEVYCKNPNHWDIINVTMDQTQYTERTGYQKETYNDDGKGSEQKVFSGRTNCDTFMIVKGSIGTWDQWHRTGLNYTIGDSIDNIDRNDVNITAEIAWNITKYFLVDPDCWLSNVTFKTFDSPNDGDTLNDSIRANFTINTVLPQDYVMLEVLYNIIGNPMSSDILYNTVNYTVNSSGYNGSIVFSIPDDATQGNYSIKIRLYNSTGRINKIVGIGEKNYNDSISSNIFHLYHPFGYTKKGSLYQSVHNQITGSVFTINENGYADNITAYINKAFMNPGPYKCILYRLNDSKLIGTTTENWTHRDDENPVSSIGWAVFNFPIPKPPLEKGIQYVITCWGENSYSRLYYDNFDYSRGRYNHTTYQENPPDFVNFTDENKLYSIYCSYTPDNVGPEIKQVTCKPDIIGFGSNVTITANVTDISGVELVKVHIILPETGVVKPNNYTMTNTIGNIYEYVFNNTWNIGQYNYTITAVDNNGNSNTSQKYCFNVSAMANISICTIKDEFGPDEYVNITDPPTKNPSKIGYELLDNSKVLHIWNRYDSYYFNTSSGIQITNHYNEYWSHNVLMLGYYNNDVWNLIYRTDELIGFNKNISSDFETFVNATLWKDLTYKGYNFRLAIRYHLGVDDNELTIIPYIKNIDNKNIPYVLGFAWEINNIQIDMTPFDNYIEINNTLYYLNDSLDLTFKNMTTPIYCWDNVTNESYICNNTPIPYFYIRKDKQGNCSESLYLRWDEKLNYRVQVKSREGQYNTPVILGIKIGTLAVGQEKYTSLYWYDASQVTYYFNSYSVFEAWMNNPVNMVDGNISSFASTNLVGDVQLCTSNTIPPETDMGIISKVELRAYGYYTGYPRAIILRPIFGGFEYGDNHYFQTTNNMCWSSWFDITRDSNAPECWFWKDVETLDCKVEDDPQQGDYQFMLYCSKVEVRVTYKSTTTPVISNPYPTDEMIGVIIMPVLNITVNDPNGDLMDITWFSNSSGSWEFFGTNLSVSNGTYHQTLNNATINGKWWYWKVNVTDGVYFVESDVYKFYTGYESKIKNTGITNFSGYLLIQVEFYNGDEWVLADDTINENIPRILLAGEELGLDSIFNGNVNTRDLIGLYGYGLYRVYAAFRNPDGDVLVCDDQSLMESSYEFTVNYT